MRAAYMMGAGGTQVLEVGERPIPPIDDDSVLIKISVSGLNHLDLWIRRGLPHLNLSYPHILGADGSGTVEKLGKNARGFKVGDPVVLFPMVSCLKCVHCTTGIESLCEKFSVLGEHVNGTNAEYIVVPSANIYPKPKDISHEEMASIPLVFVTAWEMLINKAGLKSGQRVLIHGAGSGVSTAGIQIAKSFGAEIVVTSRSQEKLKKAKALGAHHLIDTRTPEWPKQVRRIFPKGVDIVFEHIGKDFWNDSLKLLVSGGTLVTCGATTGFDAVTDLRHVFYRQLRILGSTAGSRRDFPRILEFVERKEFRPVVDRSFRLEEIAKAHEYLESSAVFGKVLLKIQ